ncbi:jg12107 [Pararge aegeria aegeria]|uniref:Jg12107 protein n=1 Tax=Pararge aegeria aegeria TaxID=348720 RepID=A0A8S4S541_9NEOP|nr:jg12107 [Pararge aegeria aegeria]
MVDYGLNPFSLWDEETRSSGPDSAAATAAGHGSPGFLVSSSVLAGIPPWDLDAEACIGERWIADRMGSTLCRSWSLDSTGRAPSSIAGEARVTHCGFSDYSGDLSSLPAISRPKILVNCVPPHTVALRARMLRKIPMQGGRLGPTLVCDVRC